MVKSNNKKSRKTRNDKFPLTLHNTGQYCKKIKGKIYYFGKDKKRALQKYLEQASELHTKQKSKRFQQLKSESLTIKELSDIYLECQQSRMEAGDLIERYYVDQIKYLKNFAIFIGPSCLIDEITTMDIQSYRNELLKIYLNFHLFYSFLHSFCV